jgi:hypothetical protein
MTDDRSLERAARSWIEAGPTRAPDRVVEAALHLITTAPQERGLRVLRPTWRRQTMNRIALFGATAAALVAVGLGAFYLSGGQPGSVGGRPTSPPPSASPSPAAQAIPDGTYTTGPMSVTAIEQQLEAEETLTEAEKESIRNDILVISGTTTLESAIEVDGTVMRGALGHDGGPLEWDSEGVSDVHWIDPFMYEVAIQCCGTQRYGVDWNGESFSLTATSPATGNVELFVRRILQESFPYSPVE